LLAAGKIFEGHRRAQFRPLFPPNNSFWSWPISSLSPGSSQPHWGATYGPSNVGIRSTGTYHGARSAQKMLPCGRIPGSECNNPLGTTQSCWLRLNFGTAAPQFRQKQRVNHWSSSSSKNCAMKESFRRWRSCGSKSRATYQKLNRNSSTKRWFARDAIPAPAGALKPIRGRVGSKRHIDRG
jgi:hypothetical protein